MHWKEIKRSGHFEEYHKGALVWSDVVRLIYAAKMPPNSIWCIDSGGIFWCQKPLYVKQSSKHATHFSGWFLT